MSRIERLLLAIFVFCVVLALTSVTGLVLFWGVQSHWPTLYFLGLPLLAALWVMGKK